MANISAYLKKIREAVYGEEVRGSIHDALDAMNMESSSAMEYAHTARDSAETFANSANRSAMTAEQKAGEAAAAAQNAKTSEDNAKLSENAAGIAKADAKQAKADAEAAKLAAQTAETAAQASADNASTDASNAAKAATDAATSALSAKQYSGKPSKPQDGTWWIWDAEKQAYVDSGIGCDLVGPTGNGIRDIKLTEGDHTPGTTDIYTVTLTDDTSYNISVYNGRNGTGAGDVLGIWFDLVIPAAGWANGQITIADSRLLALATHTYFLRADQASREEFLDCNVQPKDITTTGFITFTNDTDPTTDLTVNLVRFELSANGTT